MLSSFRFRFFLFFGCALFLVAVEHCRDITAYSSSSSDTSGTPPQPQQPPPPQWYTTSAVDIRHTPLHKHRLLNSSSSSSTASSSNANSQPSSRDLVIVFWILVSLGLLFFICAIVLATYYFCGDWIVSKLERRRSTAAQRQSQPNDESNRRPVFYDIELNDDAEDEEDLYQHVDFHQLILLAQSTVILRAQDLIYNALGFATTPITTTATTDSQDPEEGEQKENDVAAWKWWEFWRISNHSSSSRSTPTPPEITMTTRTTTRLLSTAIFGEDKEVPSSQNNTNEQVEKEESIATNMEKVFSPPFRTTTTCAICLMDFEEGDQVSWACCSSTSDRTTTGNTTTTTSSPTSSPCQTKRGRRRSLQEEEEATTTDTPPPATTTTPTTCSHAFHTDCVAQYAHSTCRRRQRQSALRPPATAGPSSFSSSSSSASVTVIECPLCRGPFLQVPTPAPT
ncbi:hypothetical protein ACA910_001645 [Epithemia clementina (nom. ined.)]